MSTYIISDIHGCYDEFRQMLKKINFSDNDRLILAGDYIDRGPQSWEMLRWLERCPDNALPLRGNHEEEFAAYIDLMQMVDDKENLGTNPEDFLDTAALYDTTKYFLRKRKVKTFFDLYGTVGRLIYHSGALFAQLLEWTEMVRQMPYYTKLKNGERECVIVHAGYRRDGFENQQAAVKFYLYAKAEGIREGGIDRGMIIAGHTPTVIPSGFAFNRGKVFHYHNRERDCFFYDIDCGCAYRQQYPNGRLACLRLDDETVFYV